jgi:hypothetical protein
MAFLGHASNELQTLDYSMIPFQKVQFLSITFNGNVLFKLPPVLLIAHRPLQMQNMDRKYDGHAWCKMITINIKNNFEISFKKACCLGHLCCV